MPATVMIGNAGSSWARGFGALLLLGAALAGLSCGAAERPPSRPATRLFDRSMSQLGVVELVVSDRARAARARALLEQVERAYLLGEQERARAASRTLRLAQESEPTDAEIRAAFAEMDAASLRAYEAYVAVQLELRELLTESEFNELARVR